MDIHYLTIDRDGVQRRFAFWGEQALTCVLREHGQEATLNIELPCGGKGICGGCAVRITGALAAPSEEERERLVRRFGERGAEGMRLACRAVMQGDCLLTIESEAHSKSYKTDNLTNIAQPCSAAFDVGTTTIALRVVDAKGAAVYQKTEHNAQRAMGADVMTRIAHCDSAEGFGRLRAAVRGQLERMLSEAGAALGLREDYAACAAAGNTAMLSIIAGIDPSPLGVAPYHPADLLGREFALPREDGSEGRRVYLLPCAGGFTGGDLVGCLAALEHFHPQLAATEGLLLCDLGTNGELALRCGERWLVTSAAAGPALEGGGIACGSGAVAHAAAALYDTQTAPPTPKTTPATEAPQVPHSTDKTAACPTERVTLAEGITAEVIGNTAACGSGAVAHAAAAICDTQTAPPADPAPQALHVEDKTAACPTERVTLAEGITAEVIGGNAACGSGAVAHAAAAICDTQTAPPADPAPQALHVEDKTAACPTERVTLVEGITAEVIGSDNAACGSGAVAPAAAAICDTQTASPATEAPHVPHDADKTAACPTEWVTLPEGITAEIIGNTAACGSGAVAHAAAALHDTQTAPPTPKATPATEAPQVPHNTDKTAARPTERVELTDGIAAEVIGGGMPRTLTGCAIIDLVAILLRRGVISSDGRMQGKEFRLCEDITLCQQDVRQLQLAKGAVAAAAKCLLRRAYGDSEREITAVVTGGLGYRITPAAVHAIGLLPGCDPAALRAIPSLALEGAALCLGEQGRRLAEDVRARCEVVELGGDALFDELFVEQLAFPE